MASLWGNFLKRASLIIFILLAIIFASALTMGNFLNPLYFMHAVIQIHQICPLLMLVTMGNDSLTVWFSALSISFFWMVMMKSNTNSIKCCLVVYVGFVYFWFINDKPPGHFTFSPRNKNK